MSIEQSLKVVGEGPTGTTVLEVDQRGMRNGSGKYITFEEMINYPLVAVPTAQYLWVNTTDGVWYVERVEVLARVTGGTSATADVLVCQGVEAVASGVSQLTAVLDIEETAPFRARGTIIASPTPIYPGDSVAFNGGGTLTGIVGVLSVNLRRAS